MCASFTDAAATEVGGTIKDYAGDGVLILIGAPLPYPDRAVRALRLAESVLFLAQRKRERTAIYAGTDPRGIDLTVAIAEQFVREVQAAGSTPLGGVILIHTEEEQETATAAA